MAKAKKSSPQVPATLKKFSDALWQARELWLNEQKPQEAINLLLDIAKNVRQSKFPVEAELADAILIAIKGESQEAKDRIRRIIEKGKIKLLDHAWAFLGSIFIREKNYSEAVEAYSKALDCPEYFPGVKSQILRIRGIAYFQADKTAEVIADYSAVIQMTDAPAEQKAFALVNRGAIYSQAGKTEEAIADFSAVINMTDVTSTKKATALFNRGVAYGQAGKKEEAIADYCTVINMTDVPIEHKATAIVNRGAAYGQTSKTEEAIADYSDVINMDNAPITQRAIALINRGVAYGQASKTEEAIADYSAVIGMTDAPAEQKAMALVNRSAAYRQIGKTEEAIIDSSAVISMENAPIEQKWNALINRSAAYRQIGKTEEAIIDSSAVISMENAPIEQKWKALINRGAAYGQEGKTEEAIADYSDVINMTDVHAEQKADALVNRGITYGHEGKMEEAIADFSTVIKLTDAPSKLKTTALIDRSVAYRQAGKTEEAIADFSVVIDMTDAPAEQKAMVLVSRGALYGQTGIIDEAIADFSTVINMTNAPAEQKAMAIVNRGVAYSQAGKTEEAIADYSAVIHMIDAPAEQKVMALVNRGLACGQTGKAEEAIADYSAVINMPGAPSELKKHALYFRGYEKERIGSDKEADDDYAKVIGSQCSEAFMAYLRLARGHFPPEKQKECFSKINASKEKENKFLSDKSQFKGESSFFLILREWNSYTPALPAEGESDRGGGYFIYHKGKGIVIDPGYDFITNFYRAGGRLCDIDSIVITHAHDDHTAELESLLMLLYRYNHDKKISKEKLKKVSLFMSEGCQRKFSGLIPLRGDKRFARIVTLTHPHDDEIQTVQITEAIKLTALPAYHDDAITQDTAIGLFFEFALETGGTRRILFTGDTGYYPLLFDPSTGEKQYYDEKTKNHPKVNSQNNKGIDCQYVTAAKEADLIVAHLGSIQDYEFQPPRLIISEQKSEGEWYYPNHLGMLGTITLLDRLHPKTAIVSEFGAELKGFHVDIVNVINDAIRQKQTAENKPFITKVVTGDLTIVYYIEEDKFLCHEDCRSHDINELHCYFSNTWDVTFAGDGMPLNRVLNIDQKRVHLCCTSQDKLPNFSGICDYYERCFNHTLPHFNEKRSSEERTKK